jgi:hypothetical protein
MKIFGKVKQKTKNENKNLPILQWRAAKAIIFKRHV